MAQHTARHHPNDDETQDEYDEDEKELINEIGKGEYIVEGSVKLDDLNDAIGSCLESDDYDSIGGYMIGLLDRIPLAGEKVRDASGNELEEDKRCCELIHLERNLFR